MSEIDTRRVHLGDVLSITTGRFFAPGGFGDVHALLDFMTGDTLFTHQIPRACEECAPALLRQFPVLAEVQVPAEFPDTAAVDRWLAERVAEYGEHFDVAPLGEGEHEHRNPLAELAEMLGPEKPIVVVVPAASSVETGEQR